MMSKNADLFVRHGSARKKGWLPRVGTAIFVLTLVLVNYWVFLKDNLTISAPSLEQTVQPPPGVDIPSPHQQLVDQPGVPVDLPEEKPATTVAGELQRGETVLQAMQKMGVDTREALPVIAAMEDVLDFRTARAGNTFRIELDSLGKVLEFEFKQSATDIYLVTRANGQLSAARKDIPTEIKVASIACAIQGSLYRSFQRCGGDAKLANLFMNLFAWDFNFFEQAREGDVLRMLIQKVYVDGKFMNYGKVIAAEYEGQAVGRYSAFYFKDPDGIEGYYTSEGQALRKEFLKIPVDYASMEGAVQSRYEPIRVKNNKSVAMQYPAPVGTPIWSVASGTVTFAGEVKKEGLVVEIQHEGGYKSRYAHMSSIAKGVTVGSQVFQKSVIGKVGGSSGEKKSYLIFSLNKGKATVDHMKENFAGGEPVPARFMDMFKRMVSRYLDELRTLDVMGLEDSQA